MKLLGRDLLIALGLLLLLEVLAQVFSAPDPYAPGEGETEDGRPALMMEGNPFLLWELVPGETEVSGGRAYVNQAGFRDQERGPKTRARAIALGDSSVYGFGVDDSQTFTAQLERALGADVINGGVPGYSSVQALNLMELRGYDLDPDLLIVSTLWSDNNFDAFVDAEVIADYGEVAGALAFREVLRLSGLFRWADYLVSSWRKDARARQINHIRGPGRQGTGQRRVPIDDYAANLERFASTMHERGGGVLFLMLANREDVVKTMDLHPWEPYREVMRAMAARWNAPLVELPEIYPRRGGVNLVLDEMHPNQAGHRVIAESVARALQDRGWPASPLVLTAPTTPLPDFDDPLEGRGLELGLTGDPERPDQPGMPGGPPIDGAPPPGPTGSAPPPPGGPPAGP